MNFSIGGLVLAYNSYDWFFQMVFFCSLKFYYKEGLSPLPGAWFLNKGASSTGFIAE